MIPQLPTDSCYGCWACFSICAVSAITMRENMEGFLYPQVDLQKCIKCKKCEMVCPSINNVYPNEQDEQPKAFAGWHKDSNVQLASSSGGIFSALATIILNKNGYVFGAAFDDKWNLHHTSVNNIVDLHVLRGSKYVQSQIGTAYAETRIFLEKGRHVLFSGTPCQIAGLYSFLSEKEYPNLVTCEVICHGVGSPKLFQNHLNEIAATNFKINQINFRYRFPSYNIASLYIRFSNRRPYRKMMLQDSFMRLFLNNLILRKCCNTCNYARIPRVADISLGDFWGVEKIFPKKDLNPYGTSIILLNSSKGHSLINESSMLLNLVKTHYSLAISHNPNIRRPSKHHKNREFLFSTMINGKTVTQLCKKYCRQDHMVKQLMRTLKWNIIGKLRQLRGVKCE